MTKLKATLVGFTQPCINVPASGPEDFIAFCARVSSDRPREDWGKGYDKLLSYCFHHKHFSVFEMADAVVEIEAPRDISRQLLRHHSFRFQEFSQRYSDKIEFTDREFRRQDNKNRQNSIEDRDKDGYGKFVVGEETLPYITKAYEGMRGYDVAKECARVILPEGLTMSKLFMKGSMRSWMTYLETRLDPTTQKEHRDLAQMIKDCLLPVFPTLFNLEKDR